MRVYWQRDAWRFLRKYPGAWPRELSAHLGMPVYPESKNPYKIAAQVLDLLRKRGLVQRAERGWEIVPGSKAPSDGRGHSPGSKLVLRAHSRHNIAKLHARKGRHVRPVATTALEQCWGWLPSISPKVDAQNESDFNTRGTVRPQETEAA